MDSLGWRTPNDRERQLVRKLLSQPFQGRDDLAEQFQSAMVRRIDEEGSLEVRIVSSVPTAEVSQRVPVVGETCDEDSVAIEVLLHVVDGFLDEIEIVKGDGSAIQRPPSEANVTVRIRT